MIVQLKEASAEQKSILERLMQLYMYDFSEIDDRDVNQINQQGLFEYKYLDSYWSESDRFPFLIYADDRIAGFALVGSHPVLSEDKGGKVIAEFFVMRKYRRRGIGKKAAFHIFDKFAGRWEVGQMVANVAAQGFWRSIISEYTNGQFTETILDNELWRGPIQSFDNSHKS